MNEDEIREYCLNCVNKPCSKNGCPLNNDIPAFIHEEDYKRAFEILCRTTLFPAICGRICPHSKQCQGACIRGIKGEPVTIGKIETIIGDASIIQNFKIPKDIDEELKNKRVAVIGSGPCGLTCAGFLAKKGVQVTIFEKYDKLGGILVHGIPNFRLDRRVVDGTIEKILDLGINVVKDKELGKDFELDDLYKSYDAIFISIGANEPNITLREENYYKDRVTENSNLGEIVSNDGIEKYNLNGKSVKFSKNEIDYYCKEKKEAKDFKWLSNSIKSDDSNNMILSANKLLELENYPDFKDKKVAVSGGGNVAMDTARTINHLGGKVTVIYRREEEQMPAERKEIEDAKNEGIEFLFKTNIKKVYRDIKQIECIKTELVKKDGESRLSPIEIDGSNYKIDMDYVVIATGSKPEAKLINSFELNEYGYIKVDGKGRTSMKNVYAGGDIAGEKATVAWASKSGRNAAEGIIEDLKRD